jgi:hypothetical protein
MSIEETGQAEQAASKPAPLLQTLGDPAAAVCVDGFCAVPETGADPANTSAANTDTTSTRGAGK